MDIFLDAGRDITVIFYCVLGSFYFVKGLGWMR